LDLELERVRRIFFDLFFGDGPETVEDPFARSSRSESVFENRSDLAFPEDLEKLDRVVGPRFRRDGPMRDALPSRV
jgi:hypothetical protein